MTTEIQELPEPGEIVIATITKVSDHGAYVTLDEYNNAQGFLHISEIAPGWVRTIGRYIKQGEKKVLLVKRVISGRSEIDLSLKQITKDQKKKKLLEVKHFEKGKTLLQSIKEAAKLSKTEIEKFEEDLFSKYDSIYDAFLDVARKEINVLNDLKLSEKILSAVEEVSSKIKLPSVQIRGVLELTCNKSNGVEIIKKILLDSTKKDHETNVEMTYLGGSQIQIRNYRTRFQVCRKKIKANYFRNRGNNIKTKRHIQIY